MRVLVRRIGVEPHSIAVGTARDDMVEITLRLHPAEPRAEMTGAGHVVEADIDLPSGAMVIYGPAGDPAWAPHISVAPGSYRIRVSYIPSGPPAAEASRAGCAVYFIYQVDLWPVSKPGPVTVLKQGPDPWAG